MSLSNGRRRALITGASAGIGAALARVYAGRGWDLVLTARREGPLQALAAELTTAHGVDVAIRTADLADPAAPGELAAALRRQGLTIDALVNNAGFSRTTGFLSTAPDDHGAMIRVMLTAPVVHASCPVAA